VSTFIAERYVLYTNKECAPITIINGQEAFIVIDKKVVALASPNNSATMSVTPATENGNRTANITIPFGSQECTVEIETDYTDFKVYTTELYSIAIVQIGDEVYRYRFDIPDCRLITQYTKHQEGNTFYGLVFYDCGGTTFFTS